MNIIKHFVYQFKGSLRIKLISILLLFSLLSLGILSATLVSKTRELLHVNLEQIEYITAKNLSDKLTAWFDNHFTNLERLAKENELSIVEDTMLPIYLQNIQIHNSDYETIFIAKTDGNYIDKSWTEGNVSDRDYFQKTLQEKQPQISDPIISKITGNWVISLTVPLLTENDDLTRVLIVTIPLSAIGALLEDTKIGETGYAYLVNNEKIFIYHPINEYILNKDIITQNKIFSEVLDKMFVKKEGYIEYDFEGEKKAQAYTPIPHTDWYLATTVPVNEINEPIKQFEKTSTIFIILSAAILAILLYFVTTNLTDRIKKIQVAMKHAEQGDLTQQVKNQKLYKCWEIMDCKINDCPAYNNANLRCWQITGTHCDNEIQGTMESKLKKCAQCKLFKINCGDELQQLGESFNNMLYTQLETVKLVNLTSAEVTTTSQNLSTALEEANAALEELSATTEELNASTQEISAEVEDATNQITQITESFHVTANDAVNIRDKGTEINQQADTGKTTAIATEEKMVDIINITQEVHRDILELQKATEEIQTIINAISNIANQTNMLALNAQIEAARAGEHGQGFAVVANEVNSLAGESARAANQIAGILNNIRKLVQSTTKVVTDEVMEIEKGADAVGGLNSQMSGIKEAIGIANNSIQSITGSINSQLEKVEITNGRIHSISQAIIENSTNLAMINETLVQQNSSFEEISESAQFLADMSEKLQTAIEFFKVS